MTEKQSQRQKQGPFNPFPAMEREVLAFWEKNKIFEKSVEQEAPRGDYVFYDGPPFATGLPHYGHIVASIMKDAVPRYWTMKGFSVERKWGWDCHGLPIENLAEKELGLADKNDIEKIGVEKFNEYCKSIVMRYAEEWKKTIRRIGRWVDMENDYKTMDPDYMESIWWVFKSLWDKGLIYRGHKAMHICPRCGTTLSNFEVTQGYKDIKDISCTVKFKLVTHSLKLVTHEDVYVLAWTTTPWTLIGNVALAVGEEIDYVLFSLKGSSRIADGNYVVAKADLDRYMNGDEYRTENEGGMKVEVLSGIKGKDLIGLDYEPLFDYYTKDAERNPVSSVETGFLRNRENGWKIYPAEFVTTEEGTGVVHIAPAFGEDDMNLGKEHNLPFIQHVDGTGRFKPEVADWPGEEVKPKSDTKATDKKIVAWLDKTGKLFAQEEYAHSYPHCWRCDTPLLNYAAESWFVKVTEIKENLVKNNQNVHWVPEHIKDGRFGKWLEQARDWAISRNRYWGSPLPVWICDKCGEREVMGGVADLTRTSGAATKIIFLRHGESEKNINDKVFFSADKGYPLTGNGREQAQKAADILSAERVEAIYSSPVERTRETAEIIANRFKLKVKVAEQLREISSGNWEGRGREDETIAVGRKEYKGLSLVENYACKRGQTGESWEDVEKRTYAFVKEIVSRNKGKTIIIVTHQANIIYALKTIKDLDLEKTVRMFDEPQYTYANPISIFMDNETKKSFDLHKQFVDKITWKCAKCGKGMMKRIPEVLDCWFESGSMPYAEMHYLGKPLPKFDPEKGKNFPAQFIAEGVDQTRGWFYTLMVLSTALFGKQAFDNCIVNGIVLAEDGQKMSKRLNNYPDPSELFERYSVDAMRYYLLSSPVLLAENLNFAEKGVEEVLRKVEMILWNVYKFYSMYADDKVKAESRKSKVNFDHILDKWIIARLNQLVAEVTKNMDDYVIPKAVRPIEEFINDLSTWYLQCSRDRFKGDDENDKQRALVTTSHVLIALSKVMAPFMPFLSEQIWQKVTGNDFKDENKSVHLESWPKLQELSMEDKDIVRHMATCRKIVELGLALRDEAGIKVRQPISLLSHNAFGEFQITREHEDSAKAFTAYQLLLNPLIQDRVNVKEIKRATKDKLPQGDGCLMKEGGDIMVVINTAMTPELKREGIKRELVRFINNMRKNAGLTIEDGVKIYWATEDGEIKAAVKAFSADILKDTLADGMEEGKSDDADLSKDTKMNGLDVWIGIKKITKH